MNIDTFMNLEEIDKIILGPDGLDRFERDVWPAYKARGYSHDTALLAWQNEVIISGLAALLLAGTKPDEPVDW